MIWVDQRLLGRTAEEIIGVMREELIQRIGRRDYSFSEKDLERD
jgi:hypothetical protein